MNLFKVAATLVIVSVSLAQVLGDISTDSDCNITKGCFYECADPSACEFLISWVNSGENVAFTLRTMMEGTEFWMALGFSDDRSMGNDSVTGCIYKNGNIVVFNAMNRDPGSSPEMLDSEGVSFTNGSYADGEFTCSFDRLKAAGVKIERFDLRQPWYLLFAKGMMRTTGIGYHGPYNRYYSEVKYSLSFQPKVTTVVPSQSTKVTTSVPSQSTKVTTSMPSQSAEVTTSVPSQPTDVTTSVPAQPTEMTTSTTTQSYVSHVVTKVNGCSRTVGCFSDCVDLTCSFIISWSVNGSNAVYTMTANLDTKSTSWIAIAFSRDNLMGDDDVMGCVADTSGQVVAFTAWNTRHSRPIMYTDPEINLIAHKTENNLLTCTFQRPLAASGGRRVNISEAWTLLFAKGLGKITAGITSISYHGPNSYVSTLQWTANNLADDGAKHTKNTLMKAHGSLMIGAWIFFASVGIVVARYYKTVWKGKLFSESVWFQIHRICMALVFCITAAGFIIIFVDVGGYSDIQENKSFLQGHPIIGIIVMILTVLNPAMAFIRPHPGTPKRPIFNWAHWFVGTSAHILGVVNIFFGVLLTKAHVPYYLVYILAAYVAWQIFVELLLEAISYFGQKIDHSEMYELCDKDTSYTEPAVECSRTVLAKRIVLVVHLFTVACFAAALIILLVLGNEKLDKD